MQEGELLAFEVIWVFASVIPIIKTSDLQQSVLRCSKDGSDKDYRGKNQFVECEAALQAFKGLLNKLTRPQSRINHTLYMRDLNSAFIKWFISMAKIF